MYNDLLTPKLSKELRLKVFNTLMDVVVGYQNGAITTREELLQEYTVAINTLFASEAATLLNHEPVVPDTAPTMQHYNSDVQETDQDLKILFAEMNQLGTLMVGLLNQILSEKDDLQGRIKRTFSKLADYKLYSGKTGVVISEGFVDSPGLDIGSSLLEDAQCNIVYDEGAATLAISKQKLLSVSSIQIDPQTFTGIVGSNEDLNSEGIHDIMFDITDGNPDSWTEFELTYFTDEPKPSNLEMTLILELADTSIVNHITIDPINFGLLNGVIVQDIQVSANGTEWTSIRGDLPLAAYNGETAEDVFLLSPASSKFSGLFSYTFLPRKAKYVSLTLTQDTPYIIDTQKGNKYRLAIGIRGIDVYSNKYSPTAELVSTIRNTAGTIRKLALLSAYLPDETSSLADVHFYLSFDDGQNWMPIQSLTEDDWEQVEILDVEEDYTSLRFKIAMQRNEEAFSKASSVTGEEEVVHRLDVVTINPNSSPQQITPSKPLANPNVTAINAPFGSRGNDWIGRPKIKIGTGIGDQQELLLPYNLDPESNIRPQDLRIFVAGVEWTLSQDITSEVATARMYQVKLPRTVVFGDMTNGLSPAVGAEIEVMLSAENIVLSRSGDFYVAVLDMPTDGNKYNVILEHCLPPSAYATSRLKAAGDAVVSGGVVEHRLPKKFLTNITLNERDSSGTVPVIGTFTDLKTSVKEVIDAGVGVGAYYVDMQAGKIYSYTFSDVYMVTARYQYMEHVQQDTYSIEKVSGQMQGIAVSIDNLVSHSQVDQTGGSRQNWDFFSASQPAYIPTPIVIGNRMSLSHRSILRGSLALETGIFGTGITPKEVAYLDGNTELTNILDTNEEEIAATTATGLYTFVLQNGTKLEPAAGIIFSNTSIFVVQDPFLGTIGDWDINWTTGLVSVVLPAGGLPSGITAAYSYNEGTATDPGRFSVDYENGNIYCATTPVTGYQISYEFAKYRIHYNIGYAVDDSLVEADAGTNIVSIDTSGLKGSLVHLIFEHLKAQNASLQELVEYFTPVVRDVNFRVLLKGMVI